MLSLYNKVNPTFSDLRGIGIQLSKLEKLVPINSSLTNFLKQPSTKKLDLTYDPGEGSSKGVRPNKPCDSMMTCVNNKIGSGSGSVTITAAKVN